MHNNNNKTKELHRTARPTPTPSPTKTRPAISTVKEVAADMTITPKMNHTAATTKVHRRPQPSVTKDVSNAPKTGKQDQNVSENCLLTKPSPRTRPKVNAAHKELSLNVGQPHVILDQSTCIR